MDKDCKSNSSAAGDTILWIAVGLMFVSLFVTLLL